MVTRVYFVRHAEAEGNIKGFLQGRTETDVTERGISQLDKLAERMKDIPLEAVYTSPMRRAYQTAEAVNRHHGLDIIRRDGLIEIDAGLIDGLYWDDIEARFPRELDVWLHDLPSFCAPEGEKMTEVYERVKECVGGIVNENRGRTIAVVSHGCALRNYLCYARGLDISHLRDGDWAENTAVSLVEYDDMLKPSIVYLNDVSHLPQELRTPRFGH